VGADTSSWWLNALSATNVPPPSNAGRPESTVVTGLAPETTYSFVLRTFDEVGNVSPFSNVASGATAPEIPIPPQGCAVPGAAPAAFSVALDSAGAVVTWQPNPDSLTTSLHVWRAVGLGGALALYATITDLGATQFQDPSVVPGNTYRYRATWSSDCGDGPATSSETVSIPATTSSPGTSPRGPTLSGSIHAYPNPSTGPIQIAIRVSAATAQPVHLNLYDAMGHLVAFVAETTCAPGTTTIGWPRTTRNGLRVAAGYYEVLGRIGSTKVRERLILLP